MHACSHHWDAAVGLALVLSPAAACAQQALHFPTVQWVTNSMIASFGIAIFAVEEQF